MKRLLPLMLPLIACIVPALGQRKVNLYNVSFDLSDPPSARIDADVTVRDGLLMIGGSVDDRPRGWADFVKDLTAKDEKGAGVKLEEYSDQQFKTCWRPVGPFAGHLRISYRVDLSFSKTHWPAGNEQAAYYDGHALFVASRVLFIVPDLESAYEVRISLPSGARLAVPWRAALDGKFRMNGNELVDNTLVAGEFGGFTLKQGKFNFTFALLGDARTSDAIVSDALRRYVSAYSRLFDQTPQSQYMITLFGADEEDGESYENSAAFTSPPPLTSDNMIMWANTLGHELFHFWCGQQITGEVYSDSQWFQEGFTEYYANLAMMRAHVMPERLFIWKMEQVLGKYLYFRSAPQFEKVSLKDAGQKKTSYRFGVYDGGWAAAFALDMLIREKTGGRKSLDDFMRLMYRKFGLTGVKFKYDDLVRAASDVSSSDVSDFFHRYVDGVETLPIASLLRRVGYGSAAQDYASEMYIYPVAPTDLKRQWLEIE